MGKRESGNGNAATAVVAPMPEVAERIVPEVKAEMFTIDIPLCDSDRGGYLDDLARHVDAALSSRNKAKIGLRRLYRGLFNTARMDNGNFVVYRSDAIIWLLEAIADAR